MAFVLVVLYGSYAMNKIIDAEFEEIEDGILQIVPKKKSQWKRTAAEIIVLVSFSIVVSRILGFFVYGI